MDPYLLEKWNPRSRAPSFGSDGGVVTGITVKDGTVYAAGYYGDPEGIGSEGFIWKGSAKQAVSPPTGSQGTQIYALAVE